MTPSGAKMIEVERQRQIDAEGWTAEHDDGHADNDLARAAAAYALDDERVWPWDGDGSWNPGSRLRQLVKAGAFIAAEIDRLQRLADRG